MQELQDAIDAASGREAQLEIREMAEGEGAVSGTE